MRLHFKIYFPKIGGIQNEKVQKSMLGSVLNISGTVSEETDKSFKMADRLVESTTDVQKNMKEIAAATNKTYENI